MQNARLDFSDFRDALFDCAIQPEGVTPDVLRDCPQLQGASLYNANLQGTSLNFTQLQGASLDSALLQGASLRNTQLQGTTYFSAKLQGASFESVQLQGAAFFASELQGVRFFNTKLQGAELTGAGLNGASFHYAELQGSALDQTELQGASFSNICVWGADIRTYGISNIVHVRELELAAEVPPKPGHFRDFCSWRLTMLRELHDRMQADIPAGWRRESALERIRKNLNPDSPLAAADAMSEGWRALLANRPHDDDFNRARASAWQSAGCAGEGAPYVIRGLLRQFEVPVGPSWQRALAVTFLDPKTCPAAAKLSDNDKAQLIQIRGPEPTPAPPAAAR